MSRFDLAKVGLGVTLMAYFGSAMGRALFQGDLWGQTVVSGFALGVVVFAQMGAYRLRARVAELEQRLASPGVNARPTD